MDALIEVFRYSLPALVVFATAYYILSQQSKNQEKHAIIKANQALKGESLKQKLNAYERLAVFSERISPRSLGLRLSTKESSGKALAQAMTIAIQQEYDHNTSQQIYVSDALWQLIETGKDSVIHIIGKAEESLSPEHTPMDLMHRLDILMNALQPNPIQHLKKAINEEAKTFM